MALAVRRQVLPLARSMCSKPRGGKFSNSPCLHCGSACFFDAEGHRALANAGGTAIGGLVGELQEFLHLFHLRVTRGGKLGAAFIKAGGRASAGARECDECCDREAGWQPWPKQGWLSQTFAAMPWGTAPECLCHGKTAGDQS